MRVSTTPDFFNEIANHPAVFRRVSPDGASPIDWGVVWESCIGIEFDGGGWVLQRIGEHDYCVHTLFRPGKERNAVKYASAMLAFAFTATMCQRLVTLVPRTLPDAHRLATHFGFRPLFQRRRVWAKDGEAHDIDYFELPIDRWIIANDSMASDGKLAHEMLGEIDAVNHGDDRVHDAYAGFCTWCLLTGAAEKGANIYNRWAALAGYMPIQAIDGKTLRFGDVEAIASENGINVRRGLCRLGQE